MPLPTPRKNGLINVPWTTTAVSATTLLTFLTPGLITCLYACPPTTTAVSKGLASLYLIKLTIYITQYLLLTKFLVATRNLRALSMNDFNRKFAKIFNSIAYSITENIQLIIYTLQGIICINSLLEKFILDPWLDIIEPKNADDGTTKIYNTKINRIFQQLNMNYVLKVKSFFSRLKF